MTVNAMVESEKGTQRKLGQTEFGDIQTLKPVNEKSRLEKADKAETRTLSMTDVPRAVLIFKYWDT